MFVRRQTPNRMRGSSVAFSCDRRCLAEGLGRKGLSAKRLLEYEAEVLPDLYGIRMQVTFTITSSFWYIIIQVIYGIEIIV